ncbi:SsrA-binding protein SmpB [Patescibacteria group bacterium]|nr:SsrA-binding protein SmpB [Patescibacteria group bacterium]
MRVTNRQARYNYFLSEHFEAGIVLTGAEVKSVKDGRIRLEEAYVRLLESGAWLVNANISPYKFADNRNYKPTRSRRLLLHKKEILSLAKKMEAKGLTLVPVSCYLKKGRIKVEVALARGKKKWDKREVIRRRDKNREVRRALRGKD